MKETHLKQTRKENIPVSNLTVNNMYIPLLIVLYAIAHFNATVQSNF